MASSVMNLKHFWGWTISVPIRELNLGVRSGQINSRPLCVCEGREEDEPLCSPMKRRAQSGEVYEGILCTAAPIREKPKIGITQSRLYFSDGAAMPLG